MGELRTRADIEAVILGALVLTIRTAQHGDVEQAYLDGALAMAEAVTLATLGDWRAIGAHACEVLGDVGELLERSE